MNRRLILALMIGLFLVFNVWAVYTFITTQHPGANDFFLRWQGTRSYFAGLNPYSREATLIVENGLYGAPARPDQYPGDFVYPFYTVILMAPLALFPYDMASAIWLVITAALIVGTFVLMTDMFNWRPPAWLLLLGMAWAFVSYPAVRGTFLGQPGVAVACMELIALWALAKDHDTLAGIVLAVSTLKPPVGIFIVPFLLLWGLRYRRWRFVISFSALFGVLFIASFLLLPSWLSDWLKQVGTYSGYTEIGSPVWIITSIYLPFLGTPGELVIDGLLVLLMLWAWYRVLLRREIALFDWTAALTLTITHLVAPRTATPHFVVFVLVFVFYFREIMRADYKDGARLVAGIMISTTVILWTLFLTTLTGKLEHPINYLPLPFGALMALWIWRRRWWEARPTIRATNDQSVAVNTVA